MQDQAVTLSPRALTPKGVVLVAQLVHGYPPAQGLFRACVGLRRLELPYQSTRTSELALTSVRTALSVEQLKFSQNAAKEFIKKVNSS